MNNYNIVDSFIKGVKICSEIDPYGSLWIVPSIIISVVTIIISFIAIFKKIFIKY